MALKRLAKLALAGAGLAAAFAAGHFLHIPLPQPQSDAPADPPVVAKAEPKPEPPKPQPAVAAPAMPVGIPMPSSFDVPQIPVPPVSFTPPPPPSVIPVVPSAPPLPPTISPIPNVEVAPPKPPGPPAEPEIVEPVASVHRFDGKYLGGDARHALIYAETGDGKAEVRCRPLAATIPNADEDAKAEAKSVAVPVGKTAYHSGRAFVITPRELLAIDSDCGIDWTFSLSGKADNGERLLGVAGFHAGKVLVASHHDPKPGTSEKSSGRVLGFDMASGRQVQFVTIEGGFDANPSLLLDTHGQLLYALGNERVSVYPLSTEFVAGTALPFPAMPATHLRAHAGTVTATTPSGFGMIWNGKFSIPKRDFAGTAPTARGVKDGEFVYAPGKSPAGEFILAAVPLAAKPEWTIPVAKAITAPPLLRGASVYFVAGEVLYRADAKTGAVCWKLTLPLGPTDALTDLTFADGELHASGAGVLVRVADRREK